MHGPEPALKPVFDKGREYVMLREMTKVPVLEVFEMKLLLSDGFNACLKRLHSILLSSQKGSASAT